MITERIERHEILLPINRKSDFWEKNTGYVTKAMLRRKGKFALTNWLRKGKLFCVPLKLRFVDLNFNFAIGWFKLCDWLLELSDKKLALASSL